MEPQDEEADVEGAWEACKSIFGVNSICRCRPCEKTMDAIFEAVEAYLGEELDCAESFKVESKRSDKQFPMGSIAISQEIGGRLAEAHPNVRVDVHHPAYTVYVEVRDHAAYVHGPALPGAGGLPRAMRWEISIINRRMIRVKNSSGQWWANSVTSNRSLVMRPMICPTLVLL
mgnify:CR=1 FL=1